MRHIERHRTQHIGWLRASVLGANDGIVSTASLIVGITAAHASHGSILVTGVAGLVAGAKSMAAGEYVSVHSQADTEEADLARERAELAADPVAEHRELTAIYVGRGLSHSLASQVAEQLSAHDAIGAHARDELGISEVVRARPIQAALASAGSFAAGSDRGGTRAPPDRVDRRDLPRVSGCAGNGGRAGRRCQPLAGCFAGDFLGCAGYGDNRRSRQYLWRCYLKLIAACVGAVCARGLNHP